MWPQLQQLTTNQPTECQRGLSSQWRQLSQCMHACSCTALITWCHSGSCQLTRRASCQGFDASGALHQGRWKVSSSHRTTPNPNTSEGGVPCSPCSSSGGQEGDRQAGSEQSRQAGTIASETAHAHQQPTTQRNTKLPAATTQQPRTRIHCVNACMQPCVPEDPGAKDLQFSPINHSRIDPNPKKQNKKKQKNGT